MMKIFATFACFLFVVFNSGFVEALKCYDCKEPCPSPKPFCNGNYCYYAGAESGSGNDTIVQGCTAHKYIDWIPGNFSINECHRVNLGVAAFHVKVCDTELCNEPCSAPALFSIITVVLTLGFYSLIH